MPNRPIMANELRLTFFGTAAGFPTPVRPRTTAIGLWRGTSLYLFDAGDGVAGQFAQAGISLEALRAVFITHLHADHVGGLPLLIQWLQLNRRTAPLPIHLPDASLEGVRDYLHLLYLWPMSQFPVDLLPVTRGVVHDDNGVRVTAIHSRHLEGGESSRAKAGERVESQAFSYLVGVEGKTIYFSGDLAEPEEAAEQADRVDLAVVELAHFTAEELGAAFSASNLPRLALTHINDGFEPFEDEIPGRVRAAGFDGDIVVATDGMEMEL